MSFSLAICLGWAFVGNGGLHAAGAPADSAGDSDSDSDEHSDEQDIVLGLIADFTSIFKDVSPGIVEGQLAYYEHVNATGGIDGRLIRPVVRNNDYDIDLHRQVYEELRSQVTAISMSLGSPHTAGIVDLLVEDQMLAIPISWASTWETVDNVLNPHATYCTAAINAVGTLMEPGSTMALIHFPGEYGEGGANGVRYAAAAHGVEIVLDTFALPLDFVPDPSYIADALAAANPDWVYVVVNPPLLAELMVLADDAGYQGMWSGSSPSFGTFLFLTNPEAGPLLEQRYIHNTYSALWANDVDGMEEAMAGMAAAFPGQPASDLHILGWIQAKAMTQLLREAADEDDLTPAGVLAASRNGKLRFDELSPTKRLGKGIERDVVRQTAFYRPSQALFFGSLGATTSDQVLLGLEPYIPLGASDLVREASFSEACLGLPAPPPGDGGDSDSEGGSG